MYFLNKWFKKASLILKVDETNYLFFKNTVNFSMFMLTSILIIYSFPGLKKYGATLFAGAGVIAAIVGFASQSAFSNIITGFFIVVFKPFRVNDTIQIGAKYKGIVEDITIRHIVIKDYENRRILIPNSIINSEIIVNSDIVDRRIRRFIDFFIPYTVPIEQIINLIEKEAINHPYCIDVRTSDEKENDVQKVSIRIVKLTETSVIVRLGVWSEDEDRSWILQTDIYKAVKLQFEELGISGPLSSSMLITRNDHKE